MKLTELFDKPAAITGGGDLYGGNTVTFDVGNVKYEVLFANFGGGDWEVSFDAEVAPGERTDQVTGTGNEFTVFSTVNKIVQQFLSTNRDRVRNFSFTSDLESRTRLYKRLAASWAKQFDLSLTMGKTAFGHSDEFVMANPHYKG